MRSLWLRGLIWKVGTLLILVVGFAGWMAWSLYTGSLKQTENLPKVSIVLDGKTYLPQTHNTEHFDYLDLDFSLGGDKIGWLEIVRHADDVHRQFCLVVEFLPISDKFDAETKQSLCVAQTYSSFPGMALLFDTQGNTYVEDCEVSSLNKIANRIYSNVSDTGVVVDTALWAPFHVQCNASAGLDNEGYFRVLAVEGLVRAKIGEKPELIASRDSLPAQYFGTVEGFVASVAFIAQANDGTEFYGIKRYGRQSGLSNFDLLFARKPDGSLTDIFKAPGLHESGFEMDAVAINPLGEVLLAGKVINFSPPKPNVLVARPFDAGPLEIVKVSSGSNLGTLWQASDTMKSYLRISDMAFDSSGNLFIGLASNIFGDRQGPWILRYELRRK